jgi:two-component system OmpR family response regulator
LAFVRDCGLLILFAEGRLRTLGGDLAIDILIAEDEPSILESLDFILRRAGWTISSVTDGDAVFDGVKRLRPRMLVLDVMLPKRSGFDVLKHIRSDPETSRLPVLILTAKGQQQDRQIAADLGANGFVTKPYSNAEVVGAVRSLLGENERST